MLVTEPALGDPVAATRAAFADTRPGPRVAVQLRAKTLPDGALVRLGHGLRGVTADAGALLLVNGRPDVAHAVRADGVHLPEDGLAPAEARRVLGADALVGASRHDLEGLRKAAAEGADYATLSPFAASPGKAPPLERGAFVAATARAGLPVLALGGIDAERIGAALAAGAYGVAVIRAVYAAPDPARALADLLTALDTARGSGG